MTDSELLAKVKAREELLARGFEWETCLNCHGLGWRRCEPGDFIGRECASCGGRGGHWKGPITK